MVSSVKKTLTNSRIFCDFLENLINDITATVGPKNILGVSMMFARGDMLDPKLLWVSRRLIARFTLHDGTYKTLSYTSTGELRFFWQQLRAASVLAVRDSCITVLSKAHFAVLLRKHAVDLNRVITRTVFEYNSLLKRPAKHVSVHWSRDKTGPQYDR